MAKKSAQDWIESLAAAAEATATKIRETAEAETREYVEKAIVGHLLDTTGRKTYADATPDACVLETLAWHAGTAPRLAAALERFEREGVSEDFRAGLLLAARLAGDTTYEL